MGFNARHLGVFSSGDLLVFGYDEKDHSPKLAMLKEDGTLLRFLEIRKGDAPDSMFGTKDGSGKGAAVYIAPAEFVSFGRSIILLQDKSAFPLLEVSEGGSVRPIHPHLPDGFTIDSLIASDHNLYARVKGSDAGVIYEIEPQSGAVLRRFEVGEGHHPGGIACIHDGKFLSFDHGDGKLIPLVGTAERSREAAPSRLTPVSGEVEKH